MDTWNIKNISHQINLLQELKLSWIEQLIADKEKEGWVAG